MKWSWKIGHLAGIAVYLHATFLILLAYVGIDNYLRGGGWGGLLYILVLLTALFAIIVLHELGHALAARRYGINTRDITLLPIGGVARLERMPEDPKQELVVALAGPAVNVVLVFVCGLGMVLLVGLSAFGTSFDQGLRQFTSTFSGRPRLTSLDDVPVLGAAFFGQLMLVNVSLVLFNLLPAFPMDGGRVLRALLAMRMDYVKATNVAAAVGQGMAFLFGFWGLFSQNPFIVFIALFVYMGASAEASMVEMRWVLGGVPVSRAMITRFQTVTPQTPLREVIDHILAGYQQDFPVLDGGRFVGMLERGDVLAALKRQGRDEPVAAAVRPDCQSADATEMLSRVFERLQGRECHALPVMQDGRLVGVIDMENLGEFIAIRSAIHQHAASPSPAPT